LITRTRHQASELAAAVKKMGAEPILVPMIEISPPKSFDEIDAAIRVLGGAGETIDWVIFTSANAVQALANRAKELNVFLNPKRIAVIGPATAKAANNAGLAPAIEPVLVPHEYVAESLAEALLQASDAPQNFLLVRAEEARDVIPETLMAAGHSIRVVAAYRNVTPVDTVTALRRIFASQEAYPDVITFTSSSTARNLVALLGEIGKKIPVGIALASIGPITSATLRELRYEPSFEAAEPTIQSLVAGIVEHLSRR
jgi:uroporphyrinogen-III synthase